MNVDGRKTVDVMGRLNLSKDTLVDVEIVLPSVERSLPP